MSTHTAQEVAARRRDIVSGMIAIVIVCSMIILGVAWSFGSFDDGYRLKASFDSAGQGLIKGSDVKLRGMNVGQVKGVKLVDGRAEVTMQISKGQMVPKTVEAVVRPKTLFGEKYVDLYVQPGDARGEADGAQFYQTDGSAFIPADKSRGGFELEEVLGRLYPLLQALNPADIKTVVSSLAEASEGMGPVVNRQLVNGQKVLDVLAAHNADTAQFLRDLARLSTELSGRSDDLVAAALSLNNVLPTLNSQSGNLNELLVQTARLSEDAADILDSNKAFIDKSFTEGQDVLRTLNSRLDKIIPLVTGLRQYLTALTAPARIPVGDGTVMAAVKAVEGHLCTTIPILCDLQAQLDAAAAAGETTTVAPALPTTPTPAPATGSTPPPGDQVTSGLQAILDLVGGLLGPGR